MRELEHLIMGWRQSMRATAGVGRETLDELENHLRESLDQLLRSGVTEPEAFRQAVTQLGSASAISSEFRKLDAPPWLPVNVTVGIGAAATLVMAILMAVRFHSGKSSLLLAGHIFTLALGYVTVWLVGALGICYVCQRCFSGASTLRVQSLPRVSFMLAGIAAGLTTVGIVLGMTWAKTMWGRFWEWDAKETAALCVLAWSCCFLSIHRLRGATPRVVLLMSLLGNVVVSLAWLGPSSLAGLRSYGRSYYPAALLVRFS